MSFQFYKMTVGPSRSNVAARIFVLSPAIERSWNVTFVGDSPIQGLKTHISTQLRLDGSRIPKPYGRYCSIIQSSGMGKSRLLDELSRKHFMIPINLRDSETRGLSYLFDSLTFMAHQTPMIGYPPPDNNVRDFLTKRVYEQCEIVPLIRSFLVELFIKTTEILKTMMGTSTEERINNFRDHMSRGQKMGSVGNDRLNFYQDVVKSADEVRP
jgi:hypothetical protein